ncbi:putative KilA-N domain-containing protein [Armadillidium vulgare]|nr:putative KilA-N domain-containing protein [Armadillidium vulgare]
MIFDKLITKKIKDNFYFIRYDEFELILNKENGYVNATKLCKLTGNEHKIFKRWYSLNSSKELIKEIKNEQVILGGADLPPPELLIKIDLKGTNKIDN